MAILLSLIFLIGCTETDVEKPLPNSKNTPTVEESTPKTEKPVNINENQEELPEPEAAAKEIRLVRKQHKTKYLLTNGIEVKQENRPISTPQGDMPFTLVQISGLVDKAVEEKINTAIENDMLEEAKKYLEEVDYQASLYCEVMLNANNLLSISIINVYSLPLYGALYRLTDGERMYLEDIFTEGTDYVSLINRNIREAIAAMGNEDYSGLIEPFTTIKKNQDFVLSGDSLFIVFRDGESGFSRRQTIEIKLADIDDYVDVTDRYSGTERKTHERTELIVRKNNIFAVEKGNVIKKSKGDVWTNYPEISGLRDEAFEKVINDTIKTAVDEAADSKLMDTLEKNPQYPYESIASIEMNIVFNRYGLLSIKRYVSNYKGTEGLNSFSKIYSFDLKEKKVIQAEDFLEAFMAKNKGVEEAFVAEVKKAAKDSLSYTKPELVEKADSIINYNFIMENSNFYFEEQWGEEVGIAVMFKENAFEGVSSEVWCWIPFKKVISVVPEDFFGW
jgi:hypothetical protein